MSLDTRTMVMLAAAVEACEGALYLLQTEHGWRVEAAYQTGSGPTLAYALTALLGDLGASMPEWPSREQVKLADMDLHATSLGALGHFRDLYRHEPLTVLALLGAE